MTEPITIDQLHEFLLAELDGVSPQSSWGETAYFYNPGNLLKRGTYFATIKEKDGDNDKGSNLDRDGVWRLNFGVPKPVFQKLFGPPPARPAKGGVIEGPWDFELLDQLTPHPVYGWMSWMAINTPSPASFERCKPLLIEAHGKAKLLFEKRIKA